MIDDEYAEINLGMVDFDVLSEGLELLSFVDADKAMKVFEDDLPEYVEWLGEQD